MRATIGKEIIKTRKGLRMSMCKLARASKLPKGTLSKIENGICDPQISTLIKIADGLDVTLSELVFNL